MALVDKNVDQHSTRAVAEAYLKYLYSDEGQEIAAEFEIAPHDLLALFKLDGVLTMKELAQHMGCDASFVTTIADTLEQHGFARREPSQRDRRVKNLVLTAEGIAAKERMMRELATRMPWCYALNDTERRCFLTLLRKALDSPGPKGGTDACPLGETRLPTA